MPSLQVRELPENIYHLLQENAKREHRSIAQEAVVTLARGLQAQLSSKKRRMELLQAINNNLPVELPAAQLNPVELLREDRER